MIMMSYNQFKLIVQTFVQKLIICYDLEYFVVCCFFGNCALIFKNIWLSHLYFVHSAFLGLLPLLIRCHLNCDKVLAGRRNPGQHSSPLFCFLSTLSLGQHSATKQKADPPAGILIHILSFIPSLILILWASNRALSTQQVFLALHCAVFCILLLFIQISQFYFIFILLLFCLHIKLHLFLPHFVVLYFSIFLFISLDFALSFRCVEYQFYIQFSFVVIQIFVVVYRLFGPLSVFYYPQFAHFHFSFN